MPWLIGGGVLVALLFAANSSAAAAASTYAPPAPVPGPYQPTTLPLHVPVSELAGLVPNLGGGAGPRVRVPAPPVVPPSARTTPAGPTHSDSYLQGFGTSTFASYPYGSPAATNTIQWWVNHYADAQPPYTNQDDVHPADIALAVHNALKPSTSVTIDDLTEFVTVLGGYGYAVQAAAVADHILSLQLGLLQPYVKKYAGTDVVNQSTLTSTVTALKAHGTAVDQASFGILLIGAYGRGFSDFGVNWAQTGQELLALGEKGGAVPGKVPAPPVASGADTSGIAPFVQKYAGTTSVTRDSLQKAFETAMTSASSSDAMAFGSALLTFENGTWAVQGSELVAMAPLLHASSGH